VFGLAARSDNGADLPGNPTASADPQTQLPPRRIEDVTGACTYDPNIDPIADLTPFMDGPYLGDSDAEVKVVTVFDPNCPHCRELEEVLTPFIEENPEAAQYFYVAYPLRQESVGQAIALTVAQEQGRFFELMEEMFRRQDNTWGMTMPELVAAVDAVGMDGAAFQAMLEDESQLQGYLTRIQAQAEAVGASFSTADGRLSVPKLAVNGRVVAPTYASYSERCLTEFIAEAEPVGAAVEAVE
jgi:protein-disulfide isomerase